MTNEQWRIAQRRLRETVAARDHATDRRSPAPRDDASAPFASVIVVCWNAAGVLERCLNALFAQNYGNYEVIVVDDGSTDDTAKIAEATAQRGELLLLRSPRNRGCSHARNVGLQNATGEILAFVDADGFADPAWLGRLVDAFAKDPRIGGVASTVFFDDNPMVLNGAGGTVNHQGWAADLSMNESFEAAELAVEALYPMGCGMALRRRAIERVGPFDDRMLNYYDDVDYGTRLWRAGYKVVVAPDAWIDHGFGAAAGGSARKRLLCERHRMRVVLKHVPHSSLMRWFMWEFRGLCAAPMPVRLQKLRSLFWNIRHLPSALACRRRMRGAPAVPDQLRDPSWGDGFPAGVPLHLRPAPQRAGSEVDMASAEVENQLLHGWFPAERVGERSYRWAATSAAVLVHLDEPAKQLRLEYAHVPVDIGGVDVHIRRVGSDEPLAIVWRTRLAWQAIARWVENHPVGLAPGDYEVIFASTRGWSDPPRETRSLALALSSLRFERSWDIASDGLDMAAAEIDKQLVSGWFDAEDASFGRYRWGGGHAAGVVRLSKSARSARLSYCLPPGSIGSLRLALTPLLESREVWSAQLPWLDSQWRDETFVLDLAAGDYLLSFDAENAWSNPEGQDPQLGAENRSLGFAIASVAFEPDG